MRGTVRWLCYSLLASCANVEDTAASWRGRHSDDLISAWGVPTGAQKLSDGRNVITYGGPFTAGTGGISGTYTCQVTFVADPAGKIVSSTMQQNAPYNCGYLLGEKPAGR